MDAVQFFQQFQDHLAPKLDTYEQAIYLYIFRQSRLIGLEEVTIGFKSARKRMACGVGTRGTPMSEGTVYEKLQSLCDKNCLTIVATEQHGKRIRLHLPNEIPGVICEPKASSSLCLEDMDFFADTENRKLILAREGNRCFYCLRALKGNNYVIEHVVSRPEGDNSYRNVVAACRECNNHKGPASAEDWLRELQRKCLLSHGDFGQRVEYLKKLRAGDLKPNIEPLAH